jgi:hypothetical protein
MHQSDAAPHRRPGSRRRNSRTAGQHRSWRQRIRRTRYASLIGALAGFLGLATLLGTAFGATGGTPAAAPADPNTNCSLTVPANPLSARGLATPYLLSATDPAKGPCHEANTAQSAFVQATVLDPATGKLAVYDPLVIDRGSKPAAAPVLPKLPAHAVVGIWFGFNANTLTLRGTRGSLNAGACVNGLGGSLFTQFAYCNAPAFFRAANTAERAGRLVVPPLGTGTDGRPCPTTRDFGLIDQDQSDNVTTDYLATADGRTAQKTTADSAALPGAVSLLNGSDNLLLIAFVDPALGCTPYTAPDLADPGKQATSLGLDEIQAARFQATPIALVPVNDPMAQVDGKASRAKTNLYRAGVDMPRLGGKDNGDPLAYCGNLAGPGAQRINADQKLFAAAASPEDGTNLFDFLTARLTASLTNLNCPQAATGAPSAPAGAPSSGTATPTATASPTTAPTMAPTAPTGAPTSGPSAQPSASTATTPPTTTTGAPAPTATASGPAPVIGAPATTPPAAAPPAPATTAAQAAAGPGTTVAAMPPAAAPAAPVPAVVPIHDVAPKSLPSTAQVGSAATMPAAAPANGTPANGTPANGTPGTAAPTKAPSAPAPSATRPPTTVGTGTLAATGASSSTLPYLGLALSLVLLGLSAFLLVGRRAPR